MSRHHAAHSGDVTHVIDDIEHMSREDAERIYGISFMEDGRVLDSEHQRTFPSLMKWAEFNKEQDELEYEEDINHYREDLRAI